MEERKKKSSEGYLPINTLVIPMVDNEVRSNESDTEDYFKIDLTLPVKLEDDLLGAREAS